jgi:hypothetical protein
MSSPRKAMAILVGVLALLVPASASAGQPDSVDPAIMQPALNPSFAPWDCWRTGTGIVCDGARTLAWEGAETIFVCEGRPVYSTGTDERTLRRYGDEAGLALRANAHVDIRETLSLTADGSGPTLRGIAQWEDHYEYLVPGDLSSRTVTRTGIDVAVTGAGVGLVIHEVGIKAFDIDDNVLLVHGPHPILDDFEGAWFAKICDAFAAMGA